MNIILLGPPGAGKTTHSKFLESRLKINHLSTSNLLKKNGITLNKDGNLVSDDIVNKIILDELNRREKNQGYILDGYPRTIYQATAFITHFIGNCHIFMLQGEIELLVRRILSRSICPQCGHVYVPFDTPSKLIGICDNCGTRLIKREDDNKSIVYKRIENESAELEGIANVLKNRFFVQHIFCEGKLNDTSNLLFERLNNFIDLT